VSGELPSAHGLGRLGTRLKALRVNAGLSSEALAERIGISQSRVSRTELAKFKIRLDTVHRWLDATGADEQTRAEILALAEQTLVRMESYRSIFRGSIATGQRIALEQEEASARIRHFQPFMIPGLLQSERYAAAVLRSGRDEGETGLAEAVATRMERGQRIRTPGAAPYHVVVMEQALRWVPAGVQDTDLRQAWRHLLTAAKAPTITVQLIPAGTAMSKAPLCGFVLTDFRADLDEPPIAQVELPAVDLTFSGDRDVAAFERTWQAMLDAALTPRQTVTYLNRMLRE
jgi:transcriptional regulator with XRE-family HTH domain